MAASSIRTFYFFNPMHGNNLMRKLRPIALTLVLLSCSLVASQLAAQEESEAIEIAEVKHKGPIDFEKEILPILRRNCLACHNTTDAER